MAAPGVGGSSEHCRANENTYRAAQYARLKGRHGRNKAIIAVAHSILVIAYHILQRGEPYKELGGDYFIERQNKDAYQRRLVKQLGRMGYEVALTTHAAQVLCRQARRWSWIFTSD